jgi:hypothetical protein
VTTPPVFVDTLPGRQLSPTKAEVQAFADALRANIGEES